MKLRVAPKAKSDLLDIFFYGLDHFGLAQAERYEAGLKATFESIRANPLLYQAALEAPEGCRRAVYRSHTIYYFIKGRNIEVARVLGRQDVRRAFR